MSRARVIGLIAVVVVVAGAALGSAMLGVGADGSDLATGGSAGGGRASLARTAEDSAPARAFGTAARLPAMGPAVIKTATLEVEVAKDDVGRAVNDATEIAGRLGGFVASTHLDAEGTRAGTVVLRVPAESFEDALTELRGLGEVDATSVSGEDVSQEFVDLEARLRNWQAQEAVLLRLMDRARSVTDTIRVQGELSRVQLEIERLRGRLSYLEDQTAMGTITATFTGGPAAGPEPPSTLARAWTEATEATLTVVSGIIVGAGFVVPLAVLAGVGILVFRGLRPRLGG